MNESSKAPVTFDSLIDNLFDPYNGYWGPLKNGGLTNDAVPEMRGTAAPGELVNIYDKGALLGSTTVQADGNWNFKPSVKLSDGAHSLTAAVSGESVQTAPFIVQVDTKGTAGKISAVSDHNGAMLPPGATTGDTQPVISGQAEPSARVHLHVYNQINEHYWLATEADDKGQWSISPNAFDTVGIYSFTVTTIDQAGNIYRSSEKYSIGFYDPNLVSYSLNSVTDAVNHKYGDFTGALTAGQSTDDNRPVLAGNANPGLRVNIYDKGVLLGATTADEEGNWTFKPAVALSEGNHSLRVAEVTPAGEAALTESFDFVVDSTPPAGGTSSLNTVEGELLASGAVTDENKFVLAGHAEANSVVYIGAKGPKGGLTQMGSTVADSDGQWQFQTKSVYVIGKWTFVMNVVDEAGNVHQLTEQPSVVYYDPAQVHVSLDAVTDNVSQGYKDFTGILEQHDATNDAQPMIHGTGNSGFVVKIYDQDTVLGSTVVDSKGEWSFKPNTVLEDGAHTLTVKEVTPDGEFAAASSFDFTVLTHTPSGNITGITDDSGHMLADHDITADPRPVISGITEPGNEIHVHILGPDGQQPYWEAVTADGEGHWSYQPKAFTDNGEYGIRIAVVDQAGNVWRDTYVTTLDYESDSPKAGQNSFDHNEVDMNSLLCDTSEVLSAFAPEGTDIQDIVMDTYTSQNRVQADHLNVLAEHAVSHIDY